MQANRTPLPGRGISRGPSLTTSRGRSNVNSIPRGPGVVGRGGHVLGQPASRTHHSSGYGTQAPGVGVHTAVYPATPQRAVRPASSSGRPLAHIERQPTASGYGAATHTHTTALPQPRGTPHSDGYTVVYGQPPPHSAPPQVRGPPQIDGYGQPPPAGHTIVYVTGPPPPHITSPHARTTTASHDWRCECVTTLAFCHVLNVLWLASRKSGIQVNKILCLLHCRFYPS